MNAPSQQRIILTAQTQPAYTAGGSGVAQERPGPVACARRDGGPGVLPLPAGKLTISAVNFVLQLKNDGQKMAGLSASFAGTRQEAYIEAHRLVKDLARLFRGGKFTVRVDRTDAPAEGYEIGPDGHTIDPPRQPENRHLTPTTSRG
jgi:hypothetical protein